MIRTLLASTALLATATLALAADPTTYEPAVEPVVFGWGGAYAGVQAGYGFGNGEIDDNPGAPGTSFDPFIPEWDMDGAFGGVYAGYNWQFGNLVAGVEADINIAGIDGSAIVGAPTLGGDIDWFGSARARLGYAFDRTLVFATGGVAFADASHFQGVSGDIGSTFTGFTVGAGVEHAFTDNLLGRLEYRYYDFGTESLDLPAPFSDRDYDVQLHTVSVGLAWKF